METSDDFYSIDALAIIQLSADAEVRTDTKVMLWG